MINKEDFRVLMGSCIVPDLLNKYIEYTQSDLISAVHSLYQSELFKVLEDKSTCLWHLSTTQLAEMLKDEVENGYLEIPEGAAL